MLNALLVVTVPSMHSRSSRSHVCSLALCQRISKNPDLAIGDFVSYARDFHATRLDLNTGQPDNKNTWPESTKTVIEGKQKKMVVVWVA